MTFQPDLISSSLKMFAALALILGGLIAVLYYVKRKSRGGGINSRSHFVTILGNTYLGLKKYITLVEIPGAILVLGITNDNISLLAKIKDQALMGQIKRHHDDFMSPSFSEQLRKISASLKGRNHTRG